MTTDLGHGRGWAADDAAASIFRIDKQIGRPVQITEAGRSAADADKNHAAWLAYQNGTGPKAPYALPASESVHCKGEATDSDDEEAPWEDNGWIQTARYDDDRDEPWHREYIKARDRHLNDPTPTPTPQEETDMTMSQIRRPDGTIFIIDETGADHLGDFKTDDIGLGELIGAAQRVFGAPDNVSAREFDIAVAIAERRAARHRALIVSDVVRALKEAKA